MKRPGLALGVILLAALGASGISSQAARAQESSAAADSTAQGTPSRSLADLGAAALADRDSLGVDSLAIVPDEPFRWFTRPQVTLTADVNADVQKVGQDGSITVNTTLLNGFNSNTNFARSYTSYRQQERDGETRNFGSSLSGALGEAARLNLSFDNNWSEDVNTLRSGDKIVVKNEQSNARLRMDGLRRAPGGIAWAARGDILDVQGSNRGTNNNRTLASGALATRWSTELREDVDLFARAGIDLAQGDRELRGQSADATTTKDSIGATLDYERGTRFTLSLDLDHFDFVEKRLDFRRSASGVIDTLGVADELKVGTEREEQGTNKVQLNTSARLLPVLGVRGNWLWDATETRYSFSQQGIIQRGNNVFGSQMDFRYAEAGSLSIDYGWEDHWNDRRTRLDETFRGRESRRDQDIGLKLNQKIGRATDFDLKASQRLSQLIYEELQNKNDRDQLVERVDGTLRSTAIPDLAANISGTVSRTNIVNISSERVGNNKEDRLFEVRGGVKYTPTSSLSLEQDARMQIVFNDFHATNDRDQFNKQGQLSSGLRYDIQAGTFFTFDYSVDFRSTGKRVVSSSIRGVAYQTTLRSFDHTLKAGIGFPVWFLKFTANTTRGFQRRENPVTGVVTPEDRGEVRMRLAGNRRFFGDNLEFRVDFQRVLAFGPRVRDEYADYWIANSGLTMRF